MLIDDSERQSFRRAGVARMAVSLSSVLGRDVSPDDLALPVLQVFDENALEYGTGILEPQRDRSWWAVGVNADHDYVANSLEDSLVLVIEMVEEFAPRPTRCTWNLEPPGDGRYRGEPDRNAPDRRVAVEVFRKDALLAIIRPIKVEAADLPGRYRIENEFGGLGCSDPQDLEQWKRRLLKFGFKSVEVQARTINDYPLGPLILTPAILAQRLKSSLTATGYPVKLHQAQELTADFFGANTWQAFVTCRDRDGALPPGQWGSYRPRFADALRALTEQVRLERHEINPVLKLQFHFGLKGTEARFWYQDDEISKEDGFIGTSCDVVRHREVFEHVRLIMSSPNPAQALKKRFREIGNY